MIKLLVLMMAMSCPLKIEGRENHASARYREWLESHPDPSRSLEWPDGVA